MVDSGLHSHAVVARCFVVNDERHILLLRRAKTNARDPGKWECPGGELKGGQ